MRFVPILALFIATLFPLLSAPAPAQAATCQFVLGFQMLESMIPGIVGDCLVDEHHNPDNGDGLQETTGPNGAGGLLVWRKADNWTAYTDGYHTWVNGPYGLRERLNTECFSWEAGCKNPLPSTTATVSFTSVTGANPGGTASATIQTQAGADCHIAYIGPLHHVFLSDGGALAPQTAPSSGTVTWSWPISADTPDGQGSVTVSCDGVTIANPIQIGSTAVTVTFTSVNGAAPGGTASATVQTMAGALCRIDYFGPKGVDRWEHGALHPDVANTSGVATWSWVISKVTPLGNGTVDVNCNGVSAQASVPIGTTPITVSFTSVTGAAPGGTASATIQTSPGALCSIDYSGPMGRDRFEDGALHPKQADSNGNITWSWLIGQNTPAGNGTINVNCEGVTASTSVAIS
jgi:hypothetical protein